jgi:hypothetical protein
MAYQPPNIISAAQLGIGNQQGPGVAEGLAAVLANYAEQKRRQKMQEQEAARLGRREARQDEQADFARAQQDIQRQLLLRKTAQDEAKMFETQATPTLALPEGQQGPEAAAPVADVAFGGVFDPMTGQQLLAPGAIKPKFREDVLAEARNAGDLETMQAEERARALAGVKQEFAAPAPAQRETYQIDLGNKIVEFDKASGKQIREFNKGAAPRTAGSMTGEGGKPLLSGEVAKVNEIDQGISQASELKDLVEKGGTGAGSAAGALVPDVLTSTFGWGADSKKRLAVIARVKQVIGKALEGGVLRKEDEEKYAKILPTIGDAPEVAKSKIDGLITTLENNREIALQGYEDVGRDVTKLKVRGASRKATGDAASSATADSGWTGQIDGVSYRKKK